MSSFTVATPGRAILDITAKVQSEVATSREVSLAHVFIHHTSASLLISENADPDVLGDLERFVARLVPDGDELFEHTMEGPDDMASHIRSALTATSLSVPVCNGRLDLGTWQAIYLWEHRRSPHMRRVTVTVF